MHGLGAASTLGIQFFATGYLATYRSLGNFCAKCICVEILVLKIFGTFGKFSSRSNYCLCVLTTSNKKFLEKTE